MSNGVWSLSRRTRRRGMFLSGGVGIAVLLVSLMSHGRARPPVRVVVITRALSAGSAVSAAEVTTASIPAPGLPSAISNPSTVIGRALTVGVVAHQPLLQADVSRTPMLQGLKANEVAVMLPVSLASSDNVQPSDRVDVIWLGGSNSSTSTGSATAPGTILAQGLRVLAVLNQNGAPVSPVADGNGLNASTPAVVEVAVPSGEAGTLAVAASSGRFWLALNPWAGPQDVTTSAPAAVLPTFPATLPSSGIGSASGGAGTSRPSGGRSAIPSGSTTSLGTGPGVRSLGSSSTAKSVAPAKKASRHAG